MAHTPVYRDRTDGWQSRVMPAQYGWFSLGCWSQEGITRWAAVASRSPVHSCHGATVATRVEAQGSHEREGSYAAELMACAELLSR